jgi:hypothetical protein
MMKNKMFIYAACLPGILMIIGYCASTATASIKTEYRPVEFSRNVVMFPDNDSVSPRMDCTFSLLEASGRREDIKFFNDQLYQGRTPAQYAESLMQNRRTEFMTNRESAASVNPAPPSFNWIYSETMDFYLLMDRCIVVKRDNYEYKGGAHGMGTTLYYVFDLTDKRVLYIRDFFREGTEERLYETIKSELRMFNDRIVTATQGTAFLGDDKPLSQGVFFTDEPGLTENFFINQEGMCFNWAPYEIAPYAAGSIEILLPWKTIRPILKPDAMELLEKFGIYMFM